MSEPDKPNEDQGRSEADKPNEAQKLSSEIFSKIMFSWNTVQVLRFMAKLGLSLAKERANGQRKAILLRHPSLHSFLTIAREVLRKSGFHDALANALTEQSVATFEAGIRIVDFYALPAR